MSSPDATTATPMWAEAPASAFDTETWAAVLAGGSAALERRRTVLAHLHAELADEPKRGTEHLSRPAAVLRALRVWRAMQRLQLAHSWGAPERRDMLSYSGEMGPFTVHDMMFVGTLQALCSDEQWRRWGPLAQAGAITGCYSQTELEHGGNVSGLQTIARWEPEHGDLVLDTPCLGATKWWSGGQGVAAQFAVVFARLLTPTPGADGTHTDHGVVPFFVQLRDRVTHTPLPGVTVGDIGSKHGFATVDNGFLQLRSVRVPRSALLGKVGTLAPDGTLTRPRGSAQAAVYAGMLFERVGMVSASAFSLAVAATIAVTYSCTRRQFRWPGSGVRGPRRLCVQRRTPGESRDALVEPFHVSVTAVGGPTPPQEVPLMAYQTQHCRLVPAVGLSFITHFTGQVLHQSYVQMQQALGGPHAAAAVTALHGLAAGLKAVLSEDVSGAMEACRRCAGGQGYLNASALPPLYSSYVHVATAGGDTFVLTQQLGRQLLAARLGMASPSTGHPYAAHLLAYVAEGAEEADGASSTDTPPPPSLTALSRHLRNLTRAALDDVVATLQRLMDGGLSAAGLGTSQRALPFAEACMHLQHLMLTPVWAHVHACMAAFAQTSLDLICQQTDGQPASHQSTQWMHAPSHAPCGMDVAQAIAQGASVAAVREKRCPPPTAADTRCVRQMCLAATLGAALQLEGAFLQHAVLTPAVTGAWRVRWLALCAELAPTARHVVRAWDVTHHVHGSVLCPPTPHTSSELLWLSAKQAPLNSPEYAPHIASLVGDISSLGAAALQQAHSKSTPDMTAKL